VASSPGVPAGLHVVETTASAEDSPAAPTVVFVHGSLDRSTSFMRTVRRLPDLNCVVYDRRGYSRSREYGPTATDVAGHVDDLLSLIGGRRVSLIGHSLGGLIVLAAAERDPSVIRSIGVYEPPLPWFEWWPQRSRVFVNEDPADFAQGFFERLVGAGSWDRLSAQAKEARRADGPALVAELAAIRDPQAEVDLANIAVPTFAGRGSRSLEHHRRAAEVVAESVPGAQLVEFDGAAHGAHLANPDAFGRFVRSVVESGAD
jgi:pimeloyl-ACP methyl ester carboxylesterase